MQYELMIIWNFTKKKASNVLYSITKSSGIENQGWVSILTNPSAARNSSIVVGGFSGSTSSGVLGGVPYPSLCCNPFQPTENWNS